MKTGLVTWMIVLSVPLAALAQAPVEKTLQLAPDDTALLVVIPNVETFVAGLAAFGKAAGVPEMAEVTTDKFLSGPLGEFRSEVETQNGFALAMAPNQTEPLVLLTLKHPDQWKEASGAQQVAGEIFSFDANYRTLFAFAKGNTLVAGPEREAVEAASRASGKAAEFYRRAAGSFAEWQQVVLVIDVPAWKPTIDQFMMMGQGLIQMGLSSAGPQGRSAMGIVTWLLDAVSTVTSEAESYVLAGAINGQGLRAADVATFKAEGKIAGYLKQVQPAREALFRGLPAEDCAMVFGYEWSAPPNAGSPVESMLRALVEPATATEPAAAAEMKEIIEKSIALQKKLTGQNFAFRFAPNGGIELAGSYLTPDGAAVLDLVIETSEMSSQFMSQLTSGTVATKISHETTEIGGKRADLFNIAFEGTDEAAVQAANAVYGESPTMIVGAVPQGLAYCIGRRADAPQHFEKVQGVGGKAPLADDSRVKAALARVPESPQWCLLVDVEKTAESFMEIARQMGSGPLVPPFKARAASADYAIFTGYLDARTIHTELYVPAEPIKALIGAFEAPPVREAAPPEESGGEE